VGGAYIYIRQHYSGRLRILASSWAEANNRASAEEDESNKQESTGPEKDESHSSAAVGGPDNADAEAGAGKPKLPPKASPRAGGGASTKTKADKTPKASRTSGEVTSSMEEGRGGQHTTNGMGLSGRQVPTTFNVMFTFNAAVMGFGASRWMLEVLDSFDAIVTHVASSGRLQEECDVLALLLAKYPGRVELLEFKAVMLASLRSLLPKHWNSEHEVAWTWLWENVQRMLNANSGKPLVQQKALRRFYLGLSEQQLLAFRNGIYMTFFAKCAAGQEYFKQSTTRLHFIAYRIMVMTQDIYKDPKTLMEDISALGLRHVGYGVPTELFGPFVTSCIEVVRSLTGSDKAAEEAFRWSIGLVSRVLVRTINEGSTIVMRAINANCAKMLHQAASCAPRGERAAWMLKVQVGTQSISPLLWALSSGSLEAARAIIADLLTIRADRDNYYYAMDDLFTRHKDIVKRICVDGPMLLTALLDGLIWRSRQTENGKRRVNYFIKYLIVDPEGNFSESLKDVIEHEDPEIICHPAVVLAADLVWGQLAAFTFIVGKSWLLLNVCVFVATQAVLVDYHGSVSPSSRLATFVGRLFIYVFTLGQLVVRHFRRFWLAAKTKEFTRVYLVPVPNYLSNWPDLASLLLAGTLLLMLTCEPILHCMGQSPTSDAQYRSLGQDCEQAEALLPGYTALTFIVTLIYFLLLLDLTVFSTKMSTFVLVCGHISGELIQYLQAQIFIIIAFSCGIASLDHQNSDFLSIPETALNLSRITLGMYSGEEYGNLHWEPQLQAAVSLYSVVSLVFMLTLLIAQMNCAYLGISKNMLAYARLSRGRSILEIMGSVSAKRWRFFTDSLQLDQRLEFNEGDVGLAGGIQMWEPASDHPSCLDSIVRFGGSTSAATPWPEHGTARDEEDKFERLEKALSKAVKRLTKGTKGKGHGSSSMGSSSKSGSGGSSITSDDDN
ncbi:unnamed protein product, partial [Polarella glacialis]